MNNSPAFPVLIIDRPKELIQYNGMTLRDYFAAKAMEGSRSRNSRYETWDALAKDAYEIADAMLRAREAE
jgi:hypothetical protein